MSFFVLRTGALDDNQAATPLIGATPTDISGFSTASAHLSLYVRHAAAHPATYRAANGDAIAVFGSLLYCGEASPAALPALLDHFDSGTFDWQGLLGSHVILIQKAQRLYAFCDGLGANKLYRNASGTLWSNSFLALCELAGPTTLDRQGCYEYVFNGAVFGSRTLVDGIRTLPANAILAVDRDSARVDQRPSPIGNEALDGLDTLDAVADYHVAQLEQVFEPLARNYGEQLRISFSGGFDSRLMLANLLKYEVKPELFVYGDEQDEDVRIARLICDAEGLPLSVIDKGQVAPPPLDAFAEETEKNLHAFDGWKVETPLFDFGADREDRLSRHRDGRVPLNGSLGEIYRNFFYMPDGASSTDAVISTFYSRFDPRSLTTAFDETAYRAAMAGAMREAIGARSDRLARSQVEEIYPKFRGRFWTGRDVQINQGFGQMFFPFLEHAAISNTARIPLRFKDLGRLQGRIIARINPRLAGYPSDYGFALDGSRPLKYRLKTFLGTHRPPALRKASFRLTHRHMQTRGGALADAYLGRVIDTDFPVMRRLFNIDAVYSADQYGLIATLEYLAERYGLQVD